MRTYKIHELFHTLQGEGAYAGTPMLFLRFTGCKAQHACYAAGVRCDTQFEGGKDMTAQQIMQEIRKFGKQTFNILLTGGEPLDQLDTALLEVLHNAGFSLFLETSGLHSIEPEFWKYLRHVTISPKVAEHVLLKNWKDSEFYHQYPGRTLELRYVVHSGTQSLPKPKLAADYYYISPHSNGQEIDPASLRRAIELIKSTDNTNGWAMSVQMHKVWQIL